MEVKDGYKAVISVDFDGIVAECDYPRIGNLREGASYYINKLIDEGYGIVINTCRSGKFQTDAEDFMAIHNVKYHHINENFPFLIDYYNGDSRKISADVYIDDKSIFWDNYSWRQIYEEITKRFEQD